MDHLVNDTFWEVAGLHPLDLAQLRGVDEDHAAGEGIPVAAAYLDGVASRTKLPSTETTPAGSSDFLRSTSAGARSVFVDDDRPGRVSGESDPQLARREATVAREIVEYC